MNELHTILAHNISVDTGIVVTVNSGIPESTIRIMRSETMILYGIGKEKEPGYTLCISVDSKSNKGKRIIDELLKNDILKKFKTFDEHGKLTFAFDFKTDIDLIVTNTKEVLTRLKAFSPQIDTTFTINKI